MRLLEYDEIARADEQDYITDKDYNYILSCWFNSDILSDFSGNLFKFNGVETKPLDITIPALKDEPVEGGRDEN